MLVEAQTAQSQARHVAIIMDGNGRWAAARGRPRVIGHQNGVEAVRQTVHTALELGVDFLTIYAFSTENWRRPQTEIRELMLLIKRFVDADLKKLKANGVRIRVIGRRDNLQPDIRDIVERAERNTADNDKLTLLVAFNYGGRDELTQAARTLALKAAVGEIDAAEIDEAMLNAETYAPDVPPPDLVIRTSGEKRISNFMIWQAAYAELIFLDVLWPDFRGEHLRAALDEFEQRDRRYGGVDAHSVAG